MYRLQREKNMGALYIALIVFGVLFAVGHLSYEFFDMALSIIFYEKANVSSVAYLICHLLFMYIPFLLFSPNGKFPKAYILKGIFLGIATCFILGNSWVIYFIAENSFMELFSADFSTLYAFQRSNALMFNYVTWFCFEPVSILYNFIAAAIYVFCAITIELGRRAFRLSVIAAVIFSMLIPLLYKFIFYANLPLEDEFGLMKNIFLALSQAFSAAALIVLTYSTRLWKQRLWSVMLNRR